MLNEINYDNLKRIGLRLFIFFLLITTLISIVAVLSGGFGDFEQKTLVTTFTISASTICCMSCIVFMRKKKKKILGYSGIGFTFAGAFLLILGVWTNLQNHFYWNTTVTFIIFALASAHSFLLMMPSLSKKHIWVQYLTGVTIVFLALLIINAVWFEVDNDMYYKFLTIVSIIVVLETVVIPILKILSKKLAKINTDFEEKIILEKVSGNIFKDKNGRIIELKIIDDCSELKE